MSASVDDRGSDSDFVSGVGGRLGVPKSRSYVEAVVALESRSNPVLARYTLVSDLAYVLSAMEVGVTPEASGKALLRCLLDLIPRAEDLGRQAAIGDVIVQREVWVVQAVGQETASWLHVGRNQGESLRAILPRLVFRDALYREQIALSGLVRALVDKAEPVIERVAPFYHHMQHAGRTTLGEYLLSWAFNLHRHFDWLAQADHHLDLAPPPNSGREVVVRLIGRVGERLGFSRQADLWQTLLIGEEQFSDAPFVFSQINVVMARLGYDLLLWMTKEFEFFDLADEHATASSGRPQKKNPFGFQTIISGAAVGAGRLAAQLSTSVTMSEELNSTFHAYSLYQYVHDVIAWTDYMADVIAKGRFNLSELEKKSTLGFAGTREALDVLVYEHKVPYRLAHHTLGTLVRIATEDASLEATRSTLQSSLKDYPNIDLNELFRTMTAASTGNMQLNIKAFRRTHETLDGSLRRIDAARGPNPVETTVAKLMDEARRTIA